MTRRAFTLLELMLAAALGAIVVITALGVFSAIDRADRRSRERLVRSQGLAAAQQTAERALRNLIMAPSNGLLPPAPGTTRPPAGEGETTPDGELPRMILEEDRGHSGFMVFRDAQGVEHSFVPQRLEIVVQSAPVYAEPTGAGIVEPVGFLGAPVRRTVAPERRTQGGARSRSSGERSGASNERSRPSTVGSSGSSRSARSDDGAGSPPGAASLGRAPEGAAGGTSGTQGNGEEPADDRSTQPEAVLAPGIRGVFETRFEPADPVRGASPSGGLGGDGTPRQERGSWSLWWRPLPIEADLENPELPQEPFEGAPSREKRTGPVRLATGLKMCRWEMVRNDETVHELEATRWEELPAYVALEIETDMGQWHKWMFEVGATRGPEPGTPVEVIVTGQINQPAQPGTENGVGRVLTPPSAGGRDKVPMHDSRSNSALATKGSRALPTRPAPPGSTPAPAGARPPATAPGRRP